MHKHPKESTEFPGFFEIEGFPGFVISEHGLVINCYQHRFVARFQNPNEYTKIHVGIGAASKFIAVHLLVARTFLPKPEGKENVYLEVNHIDGDKHNPRLSNLEWVTPQENDWHAGRTGLTVKCVPVQIRNNVSGEVTEFPSQRECAKYLGITEFNVQYMLKFGDNGKRVYDHDIQIRRYSDDEWPTTTYSQPLLKAIPVDGRNVVTGEVMQFKSIVDAANYVGMTHQTITKHLESNSQCVYKNGVQLKFANSDTWREIGDIILEVTATYGIKPVQMYYPLTGESRVFASKLICEKRTGVGAGYLINQLRTQVNSLHRYSDKTNPVAYGYYPMYSDMSLPLERLEW